MTNETSRISQVREDLKSQISEMISIDTTFITELCVTKKDTLLFTVLNKETFQCDIEDGKIIQNTLVHKKSYEDMDCELPF